jgi:hypothetical protein
MGSIFHHKHLKGKWGVLPIKTTEGMYSWFNFLIDLHTL